MGKGATMSYSYYRYGWSDTGYEPLLGYCEAPCCESYTSELYESDEPLRVSLPTGDVLAVHRECLVQAVEEILGPPPVEAFDPEDYPKTDEERLDYWLSELPHETLTAVTLRDLRWGF